MPKRLLAIGAAVVVAACGHTPTRLGVAMNEVGITKAIAGPSDPDVAHRGFLPGTLTRVKRADVLGDDQPEFLVEGRRGRNLEIRDAAGNLVRNVRTTDYLTDFGGMKIADPPKKLLVIYTYPNSTRGGTFEVFDESLHQIASWDEFPAPGYFDVARWHDRPALYYLRGDDLVVRSETGRLLATLSAPEGRIFRSVAVRELRDGLLAVVASGSGYTPYHMVCIYQGERLVYRDVDDDHAFGAEVADGGSSVIVPTRTSRWKYSLPPQR